MQCEINRTLYSAPGRCRAVVDYQIAFCPEALSPMTVQSVAMLLQTGFSHLIQVGYCVIWSRAEGSVYIAELSVHRRLIGQSAYSSSWHRTYQTVSRFPSQFLPQESNDSLKLVASCNLVELLFEDRCVWTWLEPDDHCRALSEFSSNL